MKIGLHINQLDRRGCSTVTYDYAMALRKYYGYDTCVIASRPKSIEPPERFIPLGIRLYETEAEIERIVEQEKIDVLYMAKAGNRDGICPTNCKTAVHCIFDMREQHGDVYAGVSEWLARFFKMPLWVPHIIDMPKTTGTLHDELGIPRDAFVLGRIGGADQFDIPFTHSAIKRALEQRSDLWFVFFNTKPFIAHERVRYIPSDLSLTRKSQFIDTCDAMIHARSDGETFGLAVGEFSSRNKPVLTYDAPYGWYMRAHIHMLGDRAITYKNEEELFQYLLQIDKDYVAGVDWDRYSEQFSPAKVIQQFDTVFLK